MPDLTAAKKVVKEKQAKYKEKAMQEQAQLEADQAGGGPPI